MVCQNPNCMYLHEPGEEADSYTKEDLASVKYHLKEHTSTETHKVHQLGRPLSSGTSSVFPPQKKPETPHRALGPESDRGSNDEREEASALPPTASWATKPSSTESTPVLNNKPLPQLQHTSSQQSSNSAQSQPSSHTSHHPPQSTHVIHPSQKTQNSQQSQQSYPPHLPNFQHLPPSPSQEQKSKRIVVVESSGSKAIKKIESQSVQHLTAVSKRKEVDLDIEHEKPQQLVTELVQGAKLQDQFVPPSFPSAEQSNDKPSQLVTKQNDIVADFDQTLSALSDGSFSFSFNVPLLENNAVSEGRHKDKVSTITSDNVVGSSRIVSPPPSAGSGTGLHAEVSSSNLVNTNTDYAQPIPTPYTGSFNPFATEDNKFDPFATDNSNSLSILGLSSLGSNNNIADTYTNDSRSHSSHGQSSPAKSRLSSRFGFALEDGDNAHLNGSDTLTMKDLQEDFRAIFPNVNISFGPSDVHQESMWNTSNDSTFTPPLRRTLLTAPPGVPIANNLNSTHSLHNTTSAVSLDPFQQNILLQHHQPMISSTSAPAIKSPPPGIFTPTTHRMDFGMTGGWNPQNAPWNIEEQYLSRQPSHQNQQFMQGTSRPSRDEAQDFFGAFLKAAAASSNVQDDIPNEAESLPNILQDPAIMSVRISQADSAYRAPGAPVMPQYQPIQNVGGHRLSVFERVARTGDEQIGSGFGVGIGMGDAGLNDASKEIQTTSIHSERPAEIEKESIQTLNVAHVKSPSFSAKDTAIKKSNNNLNSNQSKKPTSVKVISIKSNSGNNSQQQSKSAMSPSGQPSHTKSHHNDNPVRKSDSSSATDSTSTLNITTSNSRKKDRHSRNSSTNSNNKSTIGNITFKDSKKHGNADIQVSSSKFKDTPNQKGNAIDENRTRTSTNESSVVPSPILSKKPKKKDKNSSAQVFSNTAKNDVKKDMKANLTANDTTTIQKEFINIGESTDIDSKEFQSGVSSSEINAKMPKDFKFDFASSVLFSLPPSISGSKIDQNNESVSNLSAFESSSLDFKTPTSTTFDFSSADLFSKDFNFNTSSIFNLQTSFSSASPLFGSSSNNNNSGSPILMSESTNLWTTPNPSNAATIINNNSNGSNGLRTTTASVEDLERQVANARREAEELEHRLRAVIKKNTHLHQDAWK
ncbi:13930_t:CDS:2 [Funneliformis caledonium]|uniref:13930_t:CDS:1 n=1 Tax=Funneliformis caledonium TaxID=1117310 RepID=A0A9N9BVX9_9GLOM|nr:13930_t:CDS:2 [Funneliformis caledonium]